MIVNYGFCLCLGWRHDGLAIVVLVLGELGMLAGFAYLGLLLLLFVIFFTLAIMKMEPRKVMIRYGLYINGLTNWNTL